jgi:hypothetical protein
MNNTNIKLLLLLAVGVLSQVANGQVKIGDNPTTINNSAILEVESTTKGLLPPRMTTTQRNAITSPAIGLMIHNTITNCIEYFNGTGWFNECVGSISKSGGGNASSGVTAVVSAWTSEIGCSVGA